MILSRLEFAQHFNELKSGLGNADSVLWIPEENANASQWFVCVTPRQIHQYRMDFWQWCHQTLSGKIRCYSSSDEEQQEWWGFTEHKDIVPWLLKWT